ncbi:hypothetical protein FNV43_RR27173 [Rhamnella rubrinervis]|uniref:Transposase (putative) gypsy type domain-containing protein n=1 Tax=Rhamnella rubrinervis TaxID=2594499 RepID=A0A8K0GPX2_9ROSA|nr:hypothetical protein FNV43_RR27173 [Rhamnella rubrinervis]
MSSGDSAFEPFLEYSGRSSSPTPSLSSTSSAVRIVEPNQVAEQNPEPYVELNMIRNEPSEHRPKSVIQHPTLIKTDIPSIFKPEDMPYLKKRYGFPESAVLSAPVDGERADSVRDGWICFYEIAFKLGLKLPFHRIISMVLKYFNLAPGQLMPNEWRYLLGLIVLSEQLGQHIDMPIFLYFFYLKPGGEGRYAFYARKQTKLLTGAPTSDKGWKDRYFFVKKEGLFDPVGPSELGIRSVWAKRALNQSTKLFTNAEQNNSINVLRAAGKNLNLLLSAKSFRAVGEPTDPLWASYPTSRHGKDEGSCTKQCNEKERKRKEKKAARKASGSGPNKQSEPTPGGLEDSSSIRSDSNLITPIVDCLMTRHDKSILKSMPLEDICHEVEQGALKLAQTSRYLYEAVVKVDSAFKKKAAAHSSVVATNKILEADIANSSKPQSMLMLGPRKSRKMVQATAWPRKKKIMYRKGVEDAYLRAQKEMILKFKAGQTSWPTPEPSEDEGDDGETSEISSNESESEHVGQPEVPPVVQEGSSSPTRDSFIEAMEAARTDIPEPNSNMEEVMSVPQPSQENHP